MPPRRASGRRCAPAGPLALLPRAQLQYSSEPRELQAMLNALFTFSYIWSFGATLTEQVI